MKKQILVIGPGMEIGGVERSLLGLLDAIDYSRYDVDLFLLSHTGEFMPLINKNVNLLPENKQFSYISWPILKLLKNGKILMAATRLYCKLYGDIRAWIKRTSTINTTFCKKVISDRSKKLSKHYDVAMGFFAPHYFLNDRVNADLKIGWVHTDYGNATEKPDVKFMLPMWSKLDYIACVSEAVKASFDNVFPTLKEKSIVIENIVSSEFIKNQAAAFDTASEMPDDSAVKLLSIGRYCDAKAFDLIPEAVSRLLDRGYNLKWYIIGYGPDEQLIRTRISEFHVEDHVVLLGKKSNPYPYLKACDIYAQPSRYEGKAVTVTEAKILNKPVMITRYDTAASQVKDGFDGYICEQGVAGIAGGVEFMMNNKAFCDQLSENTKKLRYDNAEEFDKIVKLYGRG